MPRSHCRIVCPVALMGAVPWDRIYVHIFKSCCLRVWLSNNLHLGTEIPLSLRHRQVLTQLQLLGAIRNIIHCLSKHKGLGGQQRTGAGLNDKNYLLYEAIVSRLSEVAVSSTVQKQSSKMKKWRNIYQMKEQDKTSGGKKFNETGRSNFPDKEYKVRVIRCSPNWGEEWMNTVRISTKRWKI